jgi:peptide-methionine (S)-S-oxide reductase
MTARFLSAGLAAVLMFGLAAGAWAQAGGTAGGRQAPADPAEPSEDPGAAPGQGEPSGAKDPFDQAEAKAKVAASKDGDSPGSAAPKLEKATFGGGCFWHVEAEFEWLPGVKSAVSGYAGGHVPNPSYEMVHEGDTGHIEVVQVDYDPSVISYEQLLKVFWRGHDPTQWNRQGPDVGTQYRSAIFYHNEAQRKAALKSYQELTAARTYRAPIVTLLLPMKAFYRAEEYHQNYYGGKPDPPVARRPRSRRPVSAAKKATTAAAKTSGVKKEAAASESAGAKADRPDAEP